MGTKLLLLGSFKPDSTRATDISMKQVDSGLNHIVLFISTKENAIKYLDCLIIALKLQNVSLIVMISHSLLSLHIMSLFLLSTSRKR